jgi:hypothetical protein
MHKGCWMFDKVDDQAVTKPVYCTYLYERSINNESLVSEELSHSTTMSIGLLDCKSWEKKR